MSLVLTPPNERAHAAPRELLRRFDWARRCVLQWLLLALFAVGGVLLGVTLLAAHIVCRPVSAPQTRRWLRALSHRYSRLLRSLGVIDLQCDVTPPPPGTLIIANHPSLLDAPLLLSVLPGVAPVVKRSLLRNPIAAPAIYAAGYVTNDDGYQMVEDCVRRLRAGESILMFPEGTRTAADSAVRLRRGAAQLAVRARCAILPVTIRISTPVLRKTDSWWRAPPRRPEFRITALPLIEVRQYVEASRSEAIAARRLTRDLQHLYDEELEPRGPA